MPRTTSPSTELGSARSADCPLCASRAIEAVYRTHVETAAGREAIELDLCDDCGLMFRNPRPDAARQGVHYERSAEASGSVWHEHGAGSRRGGFLADRRAFLADVLDDVGPGGRLLDVGCGTGDLLVTLADDGLELHGLEPGVAAVEQARARGLSVTRGRVEEDELPEGTFDVVTAVSCLEHVDDPSAALASIGRLLRPGGWLFVEVPDSLRPTPHVAEFYSAEHLYHFTADSARRLLQEAGFEVVVAEPVTDPALRITARWVGTSAATVDATGADRAALLAAVRRYAEDRERFAAELRARLAPRLAALRADGGGLAIYGAGDHTRALLDLLELADLVVAVVDSDPRKRGRAYLRWSVCAPDDLATLDVSAVLLSSEPFQEEMAARVAPITTRRGIDVLRCYPAARAA
jgi:2-polyprenyl-3-methyl-5-hydroxy-6-metoxy-1,4-benzoquinol methylase